MLVGPAVPQDQLAAGGVERAKIRIDSIGIPEVCPCTIERFAGTFWRRCAPARARTSVTPYSVTLTLGAHWRRINTVVLMAPVTRKPKIAIIGSS